MNFKNINEINEFLKNNTKHYTPTKMVELISERIKDIDFTGKSILENSVGECNILIELAKNNESIKNAEIVIYDIEQFNLDISEGRLESEGFTNFRSVLGNFLENDIEDNAFDFCISNPPYGGRIKCLISDRIKKGTKTKKDEITFPETYFTYEAHRIAKQSFTVLPTGITFRGRKDKVVRDIIFNDIKSIDFIEGGAFESTGVETIILEIDKTEKQDSIEFKDFNKKIVLIREIKKQKDNLNNNFNKIAAFGFDVEELPSLEEAKTKLKKDFEELKEMISKLNILLEVTENE